MMKSPISKGETKDLRLKN